MFKTAVILLGSIVATVSVNSAFARAIPPVCTANVIKVVEAKSGRMIFSSQERPGRWDLKACEAKAKLESEGHGGIETKCVIEYCHRTMPVDSDK